MRWLDVAGPPGVGKSTLTDPLWGPHSIAYRDALPPKDWQPFLDEITRLFGLIEAHPTVEAAVRMNNRSVRKMAAVADLSGMGAYIQTGFAQRGLGFGWRLVDLKVNLDELRPFFRLMPVSLGVAFLHADEAAIVARNHARRTVAATAHEDRDFMVPLMREPIRVAKETLLERGVPIADIDTGKPVDAARSDLLDFAARCAGQHPPARLGGEVAAVQALPWWR